MTREEIQEFIENAPAKVGDIVWAWYRNDTEKRKGVLIGINPDENDFPFSVWLDGALDQTQFRNIEPYTAPKMRPMTHKECFELVGKWVFSCMGIQAVTSDWHTSRCHMEWVGCPISELVEPIENSPWRALEVEE